MDGGRKIRNDQPAFKFMLYLMSGIIIGIWANLPVILNFTILLPVFILCILFYRSRSSGLFFVMCIILIGMLRVSLYLDSFERKQALGDGKGCATITVLEQKTNPYFIRSYLVKTQIGSETIKGTLYAKKSMPVLNPGRKYHVSCLEWKPISSDHNPYIFNYHHYARIHGQSHSFSIPKGALIEDRGVERPLLNLAANVRNDISVRFLSVLGIEKGSLVNGFLLGLKDEIPPCLAGLFRELGVSHLLAVSGLHVGLIILILYQLLLAMSIPRVPRALIVAIFLLFYCFLTGGSPSVIRSSLMSLMLIFAPVFKRTYKALNAVAASAVILLMVNPMSLMDLGFQFSFSAVFGILTAYPKIREWFGRDWKNPAAKYIADMLSVSLSAALFTSPVALLYFNSLQLGSMALNIIVIPLTFCVMICAILSLPGLYIKSIFSTLIFQALDLSLDVFRNVLRLASRSGIWTLHVSSYWKPLIFCLIIFLLLLVCFEDRHWKRYALIMTVPLCLAWMYLTTRPEWVCPSLKKGHVTLSRVGRYALIVNTGSLYFNYNDFERNIQPVLDHWGVKNVIVIITEWAKSAYGNIGLIRRAYPDCLVAGPPGDNTVESEYLPICRDTVIAEGTFKINIFHENKMLALEYKIKNNFIRIDNDSLYFNNIPVRGRINIMYGTGLRSRE